MAYQSLSPELAAKVAPEWSAILDALGAGETVKKIAARLGVNPTAIRRYAHTDAERQQEYEQAQRDGTESLLDDLADIPNSDQQADPARTRVIVDCLKWVISKRNPDRYGDRVDVRHVHRLDMSAILLAADERVRMSRLIEGSAVRVSERLLPDASGVQVHTGTLASAHSQGGVHGGQGAENEAATPVRDGRNRLDELL